MIKITMIIYESLSDNRVPRNVELVIYNCQHGLSSVLILRE